jgi:hypothetical protein
MLINSGDEGVVVRQSLFLCPNFLGSDPIRNIVWQNTYYNAKQYWEGDDRYDQLKFFNKVLTNQFVI